MTTITGLDRRGANCTHRQKHHQQRDTMSAPEKRNPRWVACVNDIGREPAAWEFIIWNSARLNEWAKLFGKHQLGGTYLVTESDHNEYNQWLAATYTP